MLKELKEDFLKFVEAKKWNKLMEDKSKNTYRRLVEVEDRYNKNILDVDNEIIAEYTKRASYQATMHELYMINQIFSFLNSNKRLKISDFSEDMLKVNTKRFYKEKELQDICETLVNPQDKIILYGLFAGLRGTAYKELLELKVKDINFDKNYIQLKDRRIEIDNYFKSILEDAVDPLFGGTYHKYYNPNSGATSNSSYALNMESEYVIKTKPYSKNNNGLNAMTNSGLQTRVEKLSNVINRPLVPIDIVRSGIMSRMNKIEEQWNKDSKDDFWGTERLIPFLKENKLKAEPFELLRIYKQKYK